MAGPGSDAAVEVIQDSDDEGFWPEEEEQGAGPGGPAGGSGLAFRARQQEQQDHHQQEQVAAAAAQANAAPGGGAPCTSHAGVSMQQAGHDGGLWQDGCADDAHWELQQQQGAEQELHPQPTTSRAVGQGSSAAAKQQHMYRPVQAAGHAPQQQELPVRAASTGSAGTPATDQQQSHR